MIKFERRVVTNGKVFRIQCRSVGEKNWTFYQTDYDSRGQAMEVMEKWNASDMKDEEEWKEVK